MHACTVACHSHTLPCSRHRSRYWSAFSVRGYASRCFEKIAKEVFDGEEIPVANVIAREEDKVRLEVRCEVALPL